MSSNLTAEPVDRKKLDLGTSLKFILRKRYGEPISATIGDGDLPYLQGLLDAGNDEVKKDVEKLIAMIGKHGNLYLKEKY